MGDVPLLWVGGVHSSGPPSTAAVARPTKQRRATDSGTASRRHTLRGDIMRTASLRTAFAMAAIGLTVSAAGFRWRHQSCRALRTRQRHGLELELPYDACGCAATRPGVGRLRPRWRPAAHPSAAAVSSRGSACNACGEIWESLDSHARALRSSAGASCLRARASCASARARPRGCGWPNLQYSGNCAARVAAIRWSYSSAASTLMVPPAE